MEATARLIVFGPLLVAWVILFCRVATDPVFEIWEKVIWAALMMPFALFLLGKVLGGG